MSAPVNERVGVDRCRNCRCFPTCQCLCHRAAASVPVPVVNEVAEALQVACEGLPNGLAPEEPPTYDAMAEAVLAVPELAAAFEAQAKLEAATAYLREVHEVLSITTNYLLGQGEGEGRDPDECRALATNEALAGFERLDAVLFVEEGGES